MSPAGEWALKGARLVELGYDIVPLVRGKKNPEIQGWTTFKPNGDLRKWDASDVGLLTGRYPSLDIDVEDKAAVSAILDAVLPLLGKDRSSVLLRAGRFPRVLIPCRLRGDPFTRLTGAHYARSGDAEVQHVDWLASGQQAKIFGGHPTAGHYRWHQGRTLLDCQPSELPEVDLELARQVLAAAERALEGCGYQRLGGGAEHGAIVVQGDPLAGARPAVGVPLSEVRVALQRLASEDPELAEAYASWIEVGQAVHHETQGSEEGFAAWDEWSATASNYGGTERSRTAWDSFCDLRAAGVVTWRSVRRLLHRAERARTDREKVRYQTELSQCTTMLDLREICEQIQRDDDIDHIQRATLAQTVQQRVQQIEGTRPSIATARILVAKKIPEKSIWAQNWVLIREREGLFWQRGRPILTRGGFDLVHCAEIEKLGYDGTASAYALKEAKIPSVDRVLYHPGMPPAFEWRGLQCANLYDPATVPEADREETEEGRAACQLWQDHLSTLIEDPQQQRILLDYLAHVVQRPAERPTWAILIYGAEGTGKTSVAALMEAVLGQPNVRRVGGQQIENSAFNGWAEGSQLMVIEEVRFVGHNRHAVMELLKPVISDSIIELHKKGRDSYPIPNTSAVLLFTNHADAIALSDNDRRYCVLETRFRTRERLEAELLSKQPDYFAQLYDALEQHPGALRRWLLRHRISPEFAPRGMAPDTSSKAAMRSIGADEVQMALHDLLAAGEPMCNSWLAAESAVRRYLTAGYPELEVPRGKRMAQYFAKLGFRPIGRLRKERNAGERLWSRFLSDDLPQTTLAQYAEMTAEQIGGVAVRAE